MADSLETKLKSPPEDGISSVAFSPSSSQFLLVSSWDSTVRLYDVFSNTQRLKYTHERAVMDICFQVVSFVCKLLLNYKFGWFQQDAIRSFSGGLDGVLKMCDFNSNTGEI